MLYFVPRLVHARRVDQMERDSPHVGHLLDGVASGAGEASYDSPVFAQQAVEEAGLAHVGTADDGRPHAVAVDHSGVCVLQQPLQARGSLGQHGGRVDLDLTLDLVLGEVDARGEVGMEVQQSCPDGAHPLGQTATEAADGQAETGFGLGLNHVQHRLRLGQVDASVEKGAEGELAGVGHTRAVTQRQGHDALEGHRAAMTGQLHHVLARVGPGRGHGCDQHLVDDDAGLGVPHVAMHDAAILKRAVEEPGRDRPGLGAAEPHHAQPTLARWRRDGHDRVVIHG